VRNIGVMREIMGKYGFLVRKHEFFLKKPNTPARSGEIR
jgi:hypothetical protein